MNQVWEHHSNGFLVLWQLQGSKYALEEFLFLLHLFFHLHFLLSHYLLLEFLWTNRKWRLALISIICRQQTHDLMMNIKIEFKDLNHYLCELCHYHPLLFSSKDCILFQYRQLKNWWTPLNDLQGLEATPPNHLISLFYH